MDRYGAVSKETVLEMALGALKLMKSDYSAAVSGIAGPSGGSNEKPVGTVFASIASRDSEPYVWKMCFKGNRDVIIQSTINNVLCSLLMKVKEKYGR